ncbi:universal stress protein [Glycomyces niveus]|jgi:nucleotide-binding universal stress UspA family protein|uniref:Universal stress protein n=1 Tax=Glycomyces niveus TaxID=2820287 RepID=A0ABS3TZA0_9ACTN|nr:universal stress protein [Glycomyces sp. NEAU-S30]MBO3731546.1 universal stress protein [Glycomyces sp. NEAU-S30]
MTVPVAGNGVVIVGVDGSPSSRRALRWAVEQAGATGKRVVAVQAWQVPAAFGTGAMVMPGVDWGEEARTALESTIASAVGKDSRARIEQRVVEGHPASALLAQIEDASADLLVVGSRGHGGFVGTLLGSVSLHVVAHARCPVVVVHDKV